MYNEHTVDGFKGTWNISDHSLIPSSLVNFLIEYFYKDIPDARKSFEKYIPLESINKVLNEVWEGPGSMKKILALTYELRRARHEASSTDAEKVMKGYVTPTIESDLELENDED